jgi:xanthine phosphoribosyltransferase
MKRLYYSCEMFLSDTRQLARKIDRKYDAIVAIARGGMTLAHLLGEYWDLRSVYTINTIGYDDTRKRQDVQVFNLPDLQGAKEVLIVDDIVDSGDTMVEVLKHLQQAYPEVSFESAALFYKKGAKIAPTWYVREATAWIDFFWTVDLKNRE